MSDNVCPYAHGFIPQELTCRLRSRRDEKLPRWKRLFRGFRGDYVCMTDGTLPCPVMADFNKEHLKGE